MQCSSSPNSILSSPFHTHKKGRPVAGNANRLTGVQSEVRGLFIAPSAPNPAPALATLLSPQEHQKRSCSLIGFRVPRWKNSDRHWPACGCKRTRWRGAYTDPAQASLPSEAAPPTLSAPASTFPQATAWARQRLHPRGRHLDPLPPRPCSGPQRAGSSCSTPPTNQTLPPFRPGEVLPLLGFPSGD